MIKIQVEKTKDGYLIPSTLGEDIELSETDFQKLCSGLYRIKSLNSEIIFEIIPEVIEEEKQRKLQELRDTFEAQINEFLKEYSISERMTFETKRKEAEKYKETGKSFYIETLAKAKQIEPAHLAEIITQHSQAYTIAYAQLEAWRDQQEAQILKDFTI